MVGKLHHICIGSTGHDEKSQNDWGSRQGENKVRLKHGSSFLFLTQGIR